MFGHHHAWWCTSTRKKGLVDKDEAFSVGLRSEIVLHPHSTHAAHTAGHRWTGFILFRKL